MNEKTALKDFSGEAVSRLEKSAVLGSAQRFDKAEGILDKLNDPNFFKVVGEALRVLGTDWEGARDSMALARLERDGRQKIDQLLSDQTAEFGFSLRSNGRFEGLDEDGRKRKDLAAEDVIDRIIIDERQDGGGSLAVRKSSGVLKEVAYLDAFGMLKPETSAEDKALLDLARGLRDKIVKVRDKVREQDTSFDLPSALTAVFDSLEQDLVRKIEEAGLFADKASSFLFAEMGWAPVGAAGVVLGLTVGPEVIFAAGSLSLLTELVGLSGFKILQTNVPSASRGGRLRKENADLTPAVTLYLREHLEPRFGFGESDLVSRRGRDLPPQPRPVRPPRAPRVKSGLRLAPELR